MPCRDTPLRLLGYANELGEAFRPVVRVGWVYSSYALAIGYVAMDAADKGRRAHEVLQLHVRRVALRLPSLSQTNQGAGPRQQRVAAVEKVADTVLWQSAVRKQQQSE